MIKALKVILAWMSGFIITVLIIAAFVFIAAEPLIWLTSLIAYISISYFIDKLIGDKNAKPKD